MGFNTIHPNEISMLQYQKQAVIIDVREPEEYRKYHYKRAINRPYEDSDSWICRFSRRKVYIFYCEYGSTSLLAARKLGKAGFETYTVIGGVHAIREYFKD